MEAKLYPIHSSGYQIDPSEKPMYWILAVIMFFMDIFLVFLSVSLINPVKTFLKTADKKPKATIICSVITNCLFSLSSILVTVCTILILLSNDIHHETMVGEAFTKTALSSYMLSQTVLILLFIIRIDETFKGSHIQYSNLCITSLYISALLFFVFYVIFMIYFILEQWNMFVIFAIIWIVLYFCLSVTLCVLFVRKIELLIVHCSNDHHMDPALLYVVIKHAILVPIAIGSSLICLTLFIVIEYMIDLGEWVPTAVFWIVLDCVMSSMGIFLLFAWNNKYYDRYCSRLHSFCEKRDILQLSRSYSTTVAKRKRRKDGASKTDSSVTASTKTKSTSTVDMVSSQPTKSAKSTKDTKNSKNTNDGKEAAVPRLHFVESIKRISLSNKKSSSKNKNKALESRLMDDDAIAVSVNDQDCPTLDQRRMDDIEAVRDVENGSISIV